MAAIILAGPSHFAQMLTSISKTRLRSLAQDILFVAGFFSLSTESPDTSSAVASGFATSTSCRGGSGSRDSDFCFGTLSFLYLFYIFSIFVVRSKHSVESRQMHPGPWNQRHKPFHKFHRCKLDSCGTVTRSGMRSCTASLCCRQSFLNL